jgi:hypothetical protein
MIDMDKKKSKKKPAKKRKTLAKTKQGNTVAQSLKNVKAALRRFGG